MRKTTPEGLDSIDPCLGRFLREDFRFGSCTVKQWQASTGALKDMPLQDFFRPLKDLSCSACQKDCKIYATAFTMSSDEGAQRRENQLLLAVPGACTNGDVAFRT